MTSSAPVPVTSTQTLGWVCAVFSYLLWGTLPFYWKSLSNFSGEEIIVYRYCGCVIFYGVIGLWLARTRNILQTFTHGLSLKTFLLLGLASILVGANWYGYVSAVNSKHVVEASLGYYINPILNVILGTLILRERLTRWQWACAGLAILGVSWLLIRSNTSIGISLFLAITFTLYGFCRKKVTMNVTLASFWETLIMLPFALGYLGYLSLTHQHYLPQASPTEMASLLAIGVVTGLPLLLFTKAVRILPLSIVSFVQYLSPTLQLLLGVLVFGETFNTDRLIGFVFIWLAVLLFLADSSVKHWRRRHSPVI